jgi:hypothetical protein
MSCCIAKDTSCVVCVGVCAACVGGREAGRCSRRGKSKMGVGGRSELSAAVGVQKAFIKNAKCKFQSCCLLSC